MADGRGGRGGDSDVVAEGGEDAGVCRGRGGDGDRVCVLGDVLWADGVGGEARGGGQGGGGVWGVDGGVEGGGCGGEVGGGVMVWFGGIYH